MKVVINGSSALLSRVATAVRKMSVPGRVWALITSTRSALELMIQPARDLSSTLKNNSLC